MSLNLPIKRSFVKPASKFNLIYILLSILLALTSVNSLLTFFSLMTILISLRWVWRVNEPPILAFLVFYHWLQISIKIFHANLLGVDIQEIAISNSTELAIFLSLLGLLSLAFGVHLIIRKLKPIDLTDMLSLANKYSLNKLFQIYILFFVIYIFIKGITFLIPGLSQIIVGFLNFKIVLIYFIFLVSLIQKQHKVLILVVIVETIFGMSGFFSTFKLPYMLLFLAYFTIHNKVSLRVLKFAIPLSAFIVIMGLIWTGIKSEYRYALNQGASTQTITVSTDKQIELLIEHIGRVDLNLLGNASEMLAFRLAYVDIFGQVIDYVPVNKDYEYGNLWLGSIKHILTPRIFFPDKPRLDDSVRTRKYTGYHYAGFDQGVSVSIGYFAESYIDFGPYFMYFPLFLIGVLYGLIYKYLIKNVKNTILAYSMIIAVLFTVYLFEIRNDKLLGGIIMAFIMLLIMKRLFMNKLFSSNLIFKKESL